MAIKSSPTAYGNVAAGLHWLTALLIIALLVSGTVADNATEPAIKASVLTVHAPMGVTVLLLTLVRLFWWWRIDTRPPPLGGDPAWQERLAKAVHILLYLLILVMAASGISLFVLSGAGNILFGGAPGPLPGFADFAPRIPHGIGAKVLLALLVGHAGAAFFHHYIKKDATLRRIGFGRS